MSRRLPGVTAVFPRANWCNLTYILLLGGLTALLFGGEILVRGAVAIARHFNVSPMVIGLTLVGFGTSMPELVTSLNAAFAGSPGIAIGNVVGSNIANSLLILGVAALLMPIAVDRKSLIRDGSVMILASVICAGFVLTGSLSTIAGLVLLAGLAGFLILAFRTSDPAEIIVDLDAPPPSGLLVPALQFAGGLAAVIIGANWLVTGAIDIARIFGISEAVIGLTIVAVGTSLPELVTSAIAARRGQSEVAFGNVIGSNIFNIFGILGVTALVSPLPIPPEIASFDIWVMIATAILIVILSATGRRVSRGEGALLLALYAAYVLWLALT
jgi:cation:H+ antiporter